MLESLTIRHVALIDEATILFHNGLQVLSGETGAGKSIVVDAVNLILGGRADRELIRSGCGKASVEALFSVKENQRIRSFMDQEEIEYDGHTVSVFREISVNGKNICRICGVIVPVSKVKELATFLLDLHGQSEHQFLTDPDMQLQFLDQTGDQQHALLLQRTGEACEAFLSNHRAFAKLVRQGKNREERMKTLERDLSELRKAGLKEGEKERLTEEKQRLVSIEKELEGIRAASESLTEGEGIPSALNKVRTAADLLRSRGGTNPAINELGDRLESIYYDLEEAAFQLSSMIDRTDADPQLLEKTERRLDLIRRLERKYGKDADELSTEISSLEEEYQTLAGLEEKIRDMSAEHKLLLQRYRQTARDLSDSRKLLSKKFEQRMMSELSELGMGHTVFRVEFRENESEKPLMPTPSGDDRVEFMISPNPGEPLKPLSRIASGGELSRLMLAIKTLEAAHTGVESMVFDEIDTGISGRMAQVVAEKMIAISRERQVICVTHLPQIAAAADDQYLVSKAVQGQRTNTSVLHLDDRGRIDEVGRMISGADGMNKECFEYAARMIRASAGARADARTAE